MIQASMLREHGAQRPTVFEVLNHVHILRGTKSRFTYNIAPKEPPLSPRALQAPLQSRSPNIVSPSPGQGQVLDDVVTYKSQHQQQQPSRSPARNAGTEAREKVLEAIAPMRRGRPTSLAPSPSPKKEQPLTLDMKFGAAEDRAWKGVKGHKSGMASFGGGSSSNAISLDTDDFGSAWGLKTAASLEKVEKPGRGEDVFAKGFGDSFDPAKMPASGGTSLTQDAVSVSRLPPARATRDAFEGLGLVPSQPPPQTLGEARKTKTGLASLGPSPALSSSPGSQTTKTQYLQTSSGLGTSNTTYRPPSSHSQAASPSPQPAVQLASQSLSPIPPLSSGQNWRQHPKGPSSSDQPALTAEERFPSLEDLDRTFASPPLGNVSTGSKRNTIGYPSSQSSTTGRPPSRGPGNSGNIRSSHLSSVENAVGKSRFDGVRSQQVTGVAMRESKMGPTRQSALLGSKPVNSARDGGQETTRNDTGLMSRPSLTRRHKSPSFMRTDSTLEVIPSPTTPDTNPPALPPRPQPASRVEPRDWLTGADEDEDTSMSTAAPASTEQSPQPVLRDSPSKRASYIERSPILIGKTFEAESAEVQYHEPAQIEPEKPRQPDWLWDRSRDKSKDGEREKRTDERPSTPTRSKPFVNRTGTGNDLLGRFQLPTVDTNAARTGTAPSPSGLTDNWSPIAAAAPIDSPSKGSSSGDESPEDLTGYRPKGGLKEKKLDTEPSKKQAEKRHKGRQSSVHDLVDLWGGGVSTHTTASGEKDSFRPRTNTGDKRRSIIMPTPPAKPVALTNKPRAASPQPISTSHPESAISNRFTEHSPTRQTQHRKQPSNAMRSPLVSSPSAPGSAFTRARPQSMFLSSVSQSSSLGSQASSSSIESAATKLTQQTLSPPAASPSRHAVRRSSISNMVQHYEAIGGGESKGQGPGPPPPKPAGLVVKVKSSGSDNALHSPSAAAERFPRLSPTSSPVMSKANLAPPEDHTGAARSDPLKNRVSPVAGLPSRTSPVPRIGRHDSGLPFRPIPLESTGSQINGLPSRASPLPYEMRSTPQPQVTTTSTGTSMNAPHPRFSQLRKATMPAPPLETPSASTSSSSDVRSPSPEKPYQGVSRLIDRWNRAVDEQGTLGDTGGAAKRGFPAVRRAGVVGSESGRGR